MALLLAKASSLEASTFLLWEEERAATRSATAWVCDGGSGSRGALAALRARAASLLARTRSLCAAVRGGPMPLDDEDADWPAEGGAGGASTVAGPRRGDSKELPLVNWRDWSPTDVGFVLSPSLKRLRFGG